MLSLKLEDVIKVWTFTCKKPFFLLTIGAIIGGVVGWQFVSWHYEKYLLPSLHSEIRIAKERNVDLKREYTAVKQAFEKQKTHFSNTTSSENQNLVKIQQLSLELDSCKTQSANLQNKLERVGNQTHCKSPTPKTKKDLPVNDNVTTSPPSVSKEEKFNRLLSKYDPIEFNDGLNLYNVVTRKAPAPGTVYFVNFDGENPNKRRKSYGSRHYHWSSIIDDIIVHSGVGKRGQQSVVKIEVKSYKKDFIGQERHGIQTAFKQNARGIALVVHALHDANYNEL